MKDSSSNGVRVPEMRSVSEAGIVCIMAYLSGVFMQCNMSSNPIHRSPKDGMAD